MYTNCTITNSLTYYSQTCFSSLTRKAAHRDGPYKEADDGDLALQVSVANREVKWTLPLYIHLYSPTGSTE